MATDPVFYTLPNDGMGLVTTLNTDLTPASGAATGDVVFTAAANANGSKIERIMVNQVADLAAAAVLNLYIDVGSGNSTLLEAIPVNLFDLTTTTQQNADAIFNKPYDDIIIENAWTIRASVTIASAQNALVVVVFGLDAA